MRTVAIIPACDEEADIAKTIESLRDQTVPLLTILVVANNCTDNTAEVARRAGAEVLEMPHNPERKAGALNAGLRLLLPRLSPNDAVLQTDGDTILEPQLVEALAQSLERNERVGATSCAYFAKPYKGLLSTLQQAEFAMERRRIQRRRGVPACLSGVATLFRVQCFHDIAAARGTELPGNQGDFYLPGSLTEDYELTLALQTLGYELRSPERAVAWTDVMTDWGSLWKQRLRWQRGTLETLRLYGRRRCTWRPWLEQALTYLSMMMPVLLFALWGLALGTGHISWNLRWLTVIPLTSLLQLLEVRNLRSNKVCALAAFIVPMWLYGLWRTVVYWDAAIKAARRTKASWS